MKIINSEELLNIKGGAIKWGIIGLVAAGISFLVGVLDGLVRPFKCRS